MRILSLLVLILAVINSDGACQSCLMDMMLGQPHHHSIPEGTHPPTSQVIVISNIIPLGVLSKPHVRTSGASLLSNGAKSFNFGQHCSHAMRFLAARKLISTAYSNSRLRSSATVMPMPKRDRKRWAGGLFIDELSENDSVQEKNGLEEDQTPEESDDSKIKEVGEEVMSGSMIMAIKFYKGWISPLLPPACRFLPTCSQYGVQAIQEFGPSKGLILTAWRLARCSPFGGRGYDPPKWPPVAYNYGSY